VGR
jgi:hypothetical protein